jgi:hypothetical protein
VNADASKGPKGEKRPADVIGAAVMLARIATGEIEDKPEVRVSGHGYERGAKDGDPSRRVRPAC